MIAQPSKSYEPTFIILWRMLHPNVMGHASWRWCYLMAWWHWEREKRMTKVYNYLWQMGITHYVTNIARHKVGQLHEMLWQKSTSELGMVGMGMIQYPVCSLSFGHSGNNITHSWWARHQKTFAQSVLHLLIDENIGFPPMICSKKYWIKVSLVLTLLIYSLKALQMMYQSATWLHSASSGYF